MYNNQYENYMGNLMGYNMNPMMNMNNMNVMNEMYESENNCEYISTNVDSMYPEIYRIIYPMICKACMAVNENVTEDLVSRITNEVYMNVEHMEEAQQNRSSSITVGPNKSSKNDTLSKSQNSINSVSNARGQETRQRNPLLRDLIRILVLRELIGNPGRPNRPRPPFGRPPFGPGPRNPYMF